MLFSVLNPIACTNLIQQLTSIATSATPVVLTSTSNQQQYFTGISNQNVVLPVPSTLSNGVRYIIINGSGGTITVQNSALSTITTVAPNIQATFTIPNISSNSWYYSTVSAFSGISPVLDGSATPTYPTTLSNGVWYGTNTSSNTGGVNGIAIGNFSGNSGPNSTSVGSYAQTGSGSTCISVGYQAGNANSTGSSNIAFGGQTLAQNLTGSYNIAIGQNSLANTLSTDGTIGIGYQALSNFGNVTYSTGTASQSTTTITGSLTSWTANMQGGLIVFANGTIAPLTTYSNSTSFISSVSQSVSSQNYTIYYGNSYGAGTVSQSGTTVTGTGVFSPFMVGGYLIYATPVLYQVVKIIGYLNGTNLQVDQSQTVSSGTSYYIYYISGNGNIAIGYQAGAQITVGTQNTILGYGTSLNGSTISANFDTGTTLIGYGASGSNYATVLGNNCSVGAGAVGGGGVAIGYGSHVLVPSLTAYAAGIAIGKGCTDTGIGGYGGISIGNQCSSDALCVSIGTSLTSTLAGISIGFNGSSAGGVAIGNYSFAALDAISICMNNGGVQTGPGSINIGSGFCFAPGTNNIAVGTTCRIPNTNSGSNFMIGTQCGTGAPGSGAMGSNNIAFGTNCFMGCNNASISNNIAIGFGILNSASLSGTNLLGIGNGALSANISGTENNAIGHSALSANISGSYNISFGASALSSNTVADENIGIGHNALQNNTSAAYNTAVGGNTLQSQGVTTYNVGTASQTGTTITGIGTNWQPQYQGGIIVFSNGSWAYLTSYNSSTQFTSTTSQSVSTLTYTIYYSNSLYCDGTASQSGTAITGINTTFTSSMAGGILVFDNGTTAPVSVYNTATSLTSSVSQSISSQPFILYYSLIYNTGTVSQSGVYTVTGTGTTFTPQMVGGWLIYADGTVSQIASYASPTSINVSNFFTETNSAYNIIYSANSPTYNNAMGYSALQNNTLGVRNTGIGSFALNSSTLGNDNTSLGYFSGQSLTTGSKNVIIGSQSQVTGTISNSTVVGYGASSTVANGLALGQGATANTAANSLAIACNSSSVVSNVTSTLGVNVNTTNYVVPLLPAGFAGLPSSYSSVATTILPNTGGSTITMTGASLAAFNLFLVVNATSTQTFTLLLPPTTGGSKVPIGTTFTVFFGFQTAGGSSYNQFVNLQNSSGTTITSGNGRATAGVAYYAGNVQMICVCKASTGATSDWCVWISQSIGALYA